jgi:acetyl esterase
MLIVELAGQLAVATCALVAERGGPKIVYQALFYPVTDTSRESDTYKAFETNPGLESETLRWMVGAFLPNHNDRLGNLASPLLSREEQLEQLPPTLIITADVDPLRSEGETFGARLREAGVETAMFRALGTLHDFVMLNGMANATSNASIELAALKLKKALAAA